MHFAITGDPEFTYWDCIFLGIRSDGSREYQLPVLISSKELLREILRDKFSLRLCRLIMTGHGRIIQYVPLFAKGFTLLI